MKLLRISLLLCLSITLIILLAEVQQTDSVYAYAVKGIVKDLRLNPTRFIGTWFFKKAFILKKLKLKWKLKKKLILKKLLKKFLLGVAVGAKLTKLKGGGGGVRIFAPKLVLPPPPAYFAHGWGPLNYWTHAPLDLFRRKKRAIRFPDDDSTSTSGSSSSTSLNNQQPNHQFNTNTQTHTNNNNNHQHQNTQSYNEYFRNLNIASFGFSQSDMDQLKELPDNLKYEYGQEMQHLEAAASEPKEEEIQDYLSMATEFDTNVCIPKAICEIMSKGNRTTTSQFENQILDYYNIPENLEKRTGSPAYVYDYAAYLGKSTHDSRACASYFPNCPDGPQALTRFMNEVFTPEMCESPITNNHLSI